MRSLVQFVVATAIVAGAVTAHAATVEYAVVLAHQSSPGVWTVHPSHSFTSTAGDLGVSRVGPGEFEFKIGKMLPQGNVQARAHGETGDRCKVVGWGSSGPDTIVRVRCVTPAGAPADEQWVLVQYYYASGGDPAATAYLWADQPATASYGPHPSYSYNSTGAANQIMHGVAPGEYLAVLPGLVARGGDPHVTSYGLTNDYCKVATWYQGPAGTFVAVRCFDKDGEPADARWTLRYTNGHLADDGLFRGAYVLGNGNFSSGTPLHTYTPDPLFRYHTAGLPFTIDNERWAKVHFPLASAKSNGLVTAVGHDNLYCTTVGWTAFPGDIQTLAGCFDPSGTELGAAFTATMLTNAPR